MSLDRESFEARTRHYQHTSRKDYQELDAGRAMGWSAASLKRVQYFHKINSQLARNHLFMLLDEPR